MFVMGIIMTVISALLFFLPLTVILAEQKTYTRMINYLVGEKKE
jgi:hypothetical protein